MKYSQAFSSTFLYILGFLLLWEWIRPVEQLTDTSDSWIFVVFLAICVILSSIPIHFLIKGIVKWLLILYFIQDLYYEGSFFDPSWFSSFIVELVENIGFFVTGMYPEMTYLFRTLLFFILLWLMSYLLQYWLINRRRIFLFYFMTLVYITVLDTFTPYNADGAIVRAVMVGFAMMGILTFYRLADRENIEKDNSLAKRWIIPLGSLIIFSTLFGFALPKANPIWPDPVPYITSFNQESDERKGGIQRVGYGTDDSRLGGPFIGDDSVVFTTEVDSRHYWKVETKDLYTGKGWVASREGEEVVPFNNETRVPITSFVEGDSIEGTEETSSVHQIREYPHIIYPLGIKSVKAGVSNTFELDPSLEKIYSLEASRAVALNEYTVTFEIPKYSVSSLMETNNLQFNQGFIEQYTQLPENLPQRVKDLAVEITKGKSNWFDKARAVENYFKEAGFIYDKENVLIPSENDDYVDQFLFDSRRGYCDNFSTSMIVLLRSLDIPARWVKGYTEGEYLGVESGTKIYEVTNNNAHSWVEVYFPKVGWVPFEPTVGFSNQNQYNFDIEQATNSQTLDTPTVQEEQTVEQEEKTIENNNQEFSVEKFWTSIKEFFAENILWIIGCFVLFLGMLYVAYRKRARWLPYYFLWKFKRVNEDEDFLKAYLVLLKQMGRYGLQRKTGQTLRDYAKEVDQTFETSEMSRLTTYYEQYVYRHELKKGTWEETKQLWENLIKKTIA
jgi:transglutaminase-like putative cysteine protease